MNLLNRAKKIDKKAIIAQRLKRLSSIDAKLRKHAECVAFREKDAEAKEVTDPMTPSYRVTMAERKNLAVVQAVRDEWDTILPLRILD